MNPKTLTMIFLILIIASGILLSSGIIANINMLTSLSAILALSVAILSIISKFRRPQTDFLEFMHLT